MLNIGANLFWHLIEYPVKLNFLLINVGYAGHCITLYIEKMRNFPYYSVPFFSIVIIDSIEVVWDNVEAVIEPASINLKSNIHPFI